MSITTILIVITVFSSLAIIVLALMQTSKGDMGSAFGGGGSQSMFGSRGSANFLSRTTSVMVTVFFLSSITLAYFYAQRDESSCVVGGSVLDTAPASDLPVLDEDVSEVPTLEAVDTQSAEESLSEVPQLDALPQDAEEPTTSN